MIYSGVLVIAFDLGPSSVEIHWQKSNWRSGKTMAN